MHSPEMPSTRHTSFAPREKRIIAFLCKQPDASNAEIAAALGKSRKTIENQLSALYRKLELDGENYQKRIRLLLTVGALRK